jgi:hypothetical protein
MIRKSITTVLIGAATFAVSAQAAQTHPDFSGIWRSARPEAPARPAAGQAAGAQTQAAAPSAATRRGWPANAPLKPEAKAKIAEYRSLVEGTDYSPGGFCLGTGMPGSMLGSGGYPMEIIQRPEQITVIYEAHTEIRRIYTDGRKADLGEVFPSRNGYSTGRWEGDTLVVETIALKEQVDQSAAHSDQARIVERYRLEKNDKGDKTLVAELTMTDPGFYTAPVTVTKRWSAAEKGAQMIYYDCNEPTWLDHVDGLRAKKKAAAKE